MRVLIPVRLAAAALVVSSVGTLALATPATAATPTCGGLPATIVGTAGDDLDLFGDDGNDVIVGLGGNDVIEGGGGNDAVCGGGGDDKLYSSGSGDGDDVISGGAGTDMVTYAPRASTVNVSLDNVANDGAPGESDNVKTSIEDVVGSSDNDTLIGSAAANVLYGNGGNDTFNGADGNDTIWGNSQEADVINGGAGVDVVSYEFRTSPVIITLDNLANDGEAGEVDNVKADVEHLQGGSGNDSLTGFAGSNTLIGNGGDDNLEGGAGADVLKGRDGHDIFEGGPGADVLNGGAGHDIFEDGGGTGADVITGGADRDTASYFSRTNPVTVTLDDVANDGESGEGDNVKADVEHLYGGWGNDSLTGSALTNEMFGGNGNDTLKGRAGHDVLWGQDGSDTANGGADFDECHAEIVTNCEQL